MELIQFRDVPYPKLVKYIYANLRRQENNDLFFSCMRKKIIKVTPKLILEITDAPNSAIEIYHFDNWKTMSSVHDRSTFCNL